MPDIGQVAYEAYVRSMDEQGCQIDEGWHDLPRVEQDAWRAAAEAVEGVLHP